MQQRIPSFYWIIHTVHDTPQIAYYNGIHYTLTGDERKYEQSEIHMIIESPLEFPQF